MHPQWVIVHSEERPERLHDPLQMGQLLLGRSLLIFAMATKRLDIDDVVAAWSANAGLAPQALSGAQVVTGVPPL